MIVRRPAPRQHHRSLPRSRSFLPFGVAAALAILTACGPADGQDNAAATGPVTIAGVTIKTDPALAKTVPDTFSDTVRVATDVPYAPFEMFASEGSTKITGLDHDLGRAIGAMLGTDFQFTAQKFDGIIPAIQAGKFDAVISAMTDSKERQAVLTFVDYSASGTGILVVKGNPDSVATYRDLCGKTVGVQSGSSQVKLAKSWAKDCESGDTIDLQQFPKDSDAQLAITSGKVDAALLTKPSAGYVAKTSGGGDTFESIDDPAAPNGYNATPNGIGIAKSDADLATAVQKALQSLMDDGTYDKILAKYGVQGIAINKATINAGKD